MLLVEKRVRSGRAFTLIELLVVIAIIAILAAILFPVFAQVREKARQSACISNLKQISDALQMYQTEYDDWMPPRCISCNDAPVYTWPTLIFPYVKSQEVFVCPDGENQKFTPDSSRIHNANGTATNKQYCGLATNDGSSDSVAKVNKLSIALNLIPNAAGNATVNGWSTPGFWNAATPKNGFVGNGTDDALCVAAVEDSAGTIRLVDAINGSVAANVCTEGNSILAISKERGTDHFPDATSSKVAYRHSGGFTAVFGDGHAKWRRWGKTTPCDWSIQDDHCP